MCIFSLKLSLCFCHPLAVQWHNTDLCTIIGRIVGIQCRQSVHIYIFSILLCNKIPTKPANNNIFNDFISLNKLVFLGRGGRPNSRKWVVCISSHIEQCGRQYGLMIAMIVWFIWFLSPSKCSIYGFFNGFSICWWCFW